MSSARRPLWVFVAHVYAVLSELGGRNDFGRAADLTTDAEGLGGATCLRWARPEHIVFYKDTAVFPISISVPSEQVQQGVPSKVGSGPSVAGFVGSRRGGDTSEYSFGPGDELAYHAWYARHRFAATRKKGGWDATRHAEILAAGTIPIFEGLAGAPPYTLPFLPSAALLRAQEVLLPYGASFEAAYNATVEALLQHTRRCLTVEAMAAHVLRTLGLWPMQGPLRILYVSCGWGWSETLDDGWQGPVSIALFIGLQRLMLAFPGARVVEAPPLPGDRWAPRDDSYLWYTYEGGQDEEDEVKARRKMYGFGFSYARRLPAAARPTAAERMGVLDSIQRREFDAVIFGKVGPSQGCDPLPYLEEVQQAGYPPQRVALIYGGDFGLGNAKVAAHAEEFGVAGTVFFREMDADSADFRWMPATILPPACYLDHEWRVFFRLWNFRLGCWGCAEIDAEILGEVWPLLHGGNETLEDFGIGRSAVPVPHRAVCWSGLALMVFPALARSPQLPFRAWAARCSLTERWLRDASVALMHGAGSSRRHFREAFGVELFEARLMACAACSRPPRHRSPMCNGRVADPWKYMSGTFSPDAAVLGARQSLAELRQRHGVV